MSGGSLPRRDVSAFIMNPILFLLSRSRGSFLACVVLGILSGATGALLVALLYTGLNRPPHEQAALAAAFVVVIVVSPLARIGSQTLLAYISQKAMTALVLDLCDRIVAAPLARFEAVGSHRLRAMLMNDSATVIDGLAGLPVLLLNVAMIATFLGCLILVSAPLMMAVVALIALTSLLHAVALRRALVILELLVARRDRLSKHFDGIVRGNAQLKLHRPRHEAFRTQLLVPTLREHGWGLVQLAAILATTGSVMLTLFFAFTGSIVLFAPLRSLLEPAALTAGLVTLLYLAGPLDAVLSTLPMLARARTAFANIRSIAASLEPEDAIDAPGASELERWQRLELCNVRHAYRTHDGAGFVSGPIDLTFRRGELTFIAGGNGSGKTTLLKLLTGLYTPDSGDVRLDGRSMRGVPRYRDLFSAVFADVFLFDRLLGITSTNPGGVDAVAAPLLQRLGLAARVSVTSGAFSTTDVSQGQRKRLALLVALLEDRPICVFDEWAAEQDPGFRAVFYGEILPYLKARGKTVILTTHDDRYFHYADRVITLEYGRVLHDSAAHAPADARIG